MSASLRKPWPETPALAIDTPVWTAAVPATDLPPPLAPPEPSRWSEAVGLWLEWNTAYEQITQQLYQHRHNPQHLEAVMDSLDQLRQRAVRLSRELVSR